MFRLIPLACGARTDEVLDQLPHVGEVKIAVQAVGGALDTLMTHRERCQDLLYQEGCWWNVQTTIVDHHVCYVAVGDRGRWIGIEGAAESA